MEDKFIVGRIDFGNSVLLGTRPCEKNVEKKSKLIEEIMNSPIHNHDGHIKKLSDQCKDYWERKADERNAILYPNMTREEIHAKLEEGFKGETQYEEWENAKKLKKIEIVCELEEPFKSPEQKLHDEIEFLIKEETRKQLVVIKELYNKDLDNYSEYSAEVFNETSINHFKKKLTTILENYFNGEV